VSEHNKKKTTIHGPDWTYIFVPTDSEMVLVLLRHPEVDLTYQNRWFEDPLLLAVKGGHVLIIDMVQQDRRLQPTSLWAPLHFSEEGPIREAIQKRVNDLSSRRGAGTALSSKWRLGGLLCCDMRLVQIRNQAEPSELIPRYL
jgi:hypothetical protein